MNAKLDFHQHWVHHVENRCTLYPVRFHGEPPCLRALRFPDLLALPTQEVHRERQTTPAPPL